MLVCDQVLTEQERLNYLDAVKKMSHVTAKYYEVRDATETELYIAIENPRWRTQVALAKIVQMEPNDE